MKNTSRIDSYKKYFTESTTIERVPEDEPFLFEGYLYKKFEEFAIMCLEGDHPLKIQAGDEVLIRSPRAAAVEEAAKLLKNCAALKNTNAIRKLACKAINYTVYRKPLINEGTMGGVFKLEDYSSLSIRFDAKDLGVSEYRYVLTINTKEASISSGYSDELVSFDIPSSVSCEFDKIGTLLFSWEERTELESEYTAGITSIEPESDDYWDKDTGEYVNRFAMDEQYNWDARYGRYVERVRRSYRDDEPVYAGTFRNSQYEQLKALNRARFPASEKTHKLSAPADGKIPTARELYLSGKASGRKVVSKDLVLD